MEFTLTQEHEMIRAMTRDFAEGRLRVDVRERDEKKIFPEDRYRELAGLGLMGICIPAQYGGAEAGVVAYSLALQELARVDASVTVTCSVTNMVAEILLHWGNEEQKRRFLPLITSGDAIAGSFALSEAGAGSDPSCMKARAELKGDHYLVNGEKMWITSGGYAGVIILFARTGEPGKGGISAFIVTPDLPGFSVGREEDKMGLRSSNTVSLVFEDCMVPVENLLGHPGDGLRVAFSALDGGRVGVASQATGIAQGALEAAARYASERFQFGKPIGEFGSIQNYIADMACQVDAARLLTLRAAWLREQGRPAKREASMAKLYASEAANRVCGAAIQVHGGYGYVKDFDVERFYREARVTTIYEGTSEIQRIVIARELLRNAQF
jgi:alkylation response protein AidB-like acyl-CoA dehydrogenase